MATRDELSAAAREIIREWGMGKLSLKKRPRERRKRRSLPRNGVISVASETAEAAHYVYVICGDATPVKIGIAKDPHQRLAAIQTGHPDRLRIHCAIDVGSHRAARATEAAAHAQLANFRRTGEWFDCTPYDAADLVRQVIAELS